MVHNGQYRNIGWQKGKLPQAAISALASPSHPAAAANAQPPKSGAANDAPTASPLRETEVIRRRLALLSRISRKAGSTQQLSRLVEQVTQLAQRALGAQASSVLLLDEEGKNLVFEVADGPAGGQLKLVEIGARSGIAGWVASRAQAVLANEAANDPRFDRSIDSVTGFVTKSIVCAPLSTRGKVIGVIEVLNKEQGSFNGNDLNILACAANTAAVAIDGAGTQQKILDSYRSTVRALAAAIDARDPYASGHSQRVSEYVLLAMNSLPLTRDDKETIEYAAILHDIGKAYIAERILLKPGPFTAEEWGVMRRHAAIGYNMLKAIPFLENASRLVLCHHERYDGNGYPNGLKGEASPLGARLIAVADAFDTMTTTHLYRVACDVDYALQKLRRSAGTQFCPKSAQAFITGFLKFHSPQ